MSWVTNAKEALRRGETVQVRPRGHSMSGKVNDGDYLAPTLLRIWNVSWSRRAAQRR